MTITGPKRRPQEFGFRRGDTHIVINASTNTAKAYDFDGKLLWEVPALPQGQDWRWWVRNGDTPPGLYKLGAIWRDYETGKMLTAYGWYVFDMIDLEGNEDRNGRAGIAIHGGGTVLGRVLALARRQPLRSTHGCVRMHNEDLRDKVLPRYEMGTVFVSVFQDRK